MTFGRTIAVATEGSLIVSRNYGAFLEPHAGGCSTAFYRIDGPFMPDEAMSRLVPT
jgi:hypothetical protein